MRSSCDAVATNERRASSCSRSRCCMDGQCPSQIAHLVAGAVHRNLDRRPLVRELQRRLAQPPQPAHERGRQRDAEDQAERQTGQDGGDERACARR